eukprot:TRINITY_DN22818_c0_g1_i1.p1 TRINITY_DN22818_c0_g1~~TRINITY_DN22818_c0_g1_i1.p1  ORF type:complete len:253 (+),score=62.49 TRINITY_DN22818_c0_g1_i1:92-760(+)
MLRSLVGSEMCIRDRSTQSTGVVKAMASEPPPLQALFERLRPPPEDPNIVRLTGSHGEIEVDWATLEAVLQTFGDKCRREHQPMPDPRQGPKLVPPPGVVMDPVPLVAAPRLPRETNGKGKKQTKRRGELTLDGYRWRKYGQKLLTFSQQYREYFKCTHPDCPAKRQVELIPETGQIVTSSSTAHNHAMGAKRPKLDKPPAAGDNGTRVRAGQAVVELCSTA